jgi:hypothetical protein
MNILTNHILNELSGCYGTTLMVLLIGACTGCEYCPPVFVGMLVARLAYRVFEHVLAENPLSTIF